MSFKNFIQEKIILPCSDILTGQSVNKYLRLLMQSQYWSRQQIDNFQNERLRLLIAHAYANVPFYRDEMDKLGLKPADIQTKTDLKKLPILTKAQIKKEGISRFTAKNIPSKQIMKAASSGSTGEPLHYLRTKEAYSVNIAANLRGWYGMEYRLGDRYVKLSGQSRKKLIKRIQDKITNNLYVPTSPLTDENFAHILQSIETYKPKIIRCYPDPLLLIARYKKTYSEYKYSPLAINTTGSILSFESRKEIEDAFGCKIFDAYSCEGNACVFECPTHSCYHSAEEYGISEIIDEYGNPVEKGIGRLISTDLWNFAHPFIRYNTQDLLEINDSPCECGRKHLKVLKIWGRENEILVMPSGRKFTAHDFSIFITNNSIIDKSIEQFQIIKKRDNSVRFKLVVNQRFNTKTEIYFTNFWEKELGVSVTVELLKEIPIMKNNKRRFIVNE